MTRDDFKTGLHREGYEVGEKELGPHHASEPHAHEFDVRLLVVDGALTLALEGGLQTYAAGQICNLAAGTTHEEQTQDAGARYIVGRRVPASVS